MNKRLLYSVAICTYNPLPQIFEKTINAVRRIISLSKELISEIIIIDNNSMPPVSELPFIKDLLDTNSNILLFEECKQGLAYARVKAISESKGNVIVFFDDDNEPDADYIINLNTCLLRYPGVGAWGPGDITVKFIGDVSHVFQDRYKEFYQEKHFDTVLFGCQIEAWLPCYPFGTGLALRKCVANEYVKKFESRQLSTIGRCAGNMSSAEDLQMVWEAIKLGYSAGVSPSLKLNHLIGEHKANEEYLKKLVFGCAYSYLSAFNESFSKQGHHKNSLQNNHSSKVFNWLYTLKITFMILLKFFEYLFKKQLYLYKFSVISILASYKSKSDINPHLKLNWIEQLIEALMK